MEEAYVNIFGAIIRQAMSDYIEYHMKINRGSRVSDSCVLNYESAERYLFHERGLESTLSTYGLADSISIDFIRRRAKSGIELGRAFHSL